MQDKRIWEIDFLRGMALSLMIYFHIVFDLKEFFGYNVSYSSGWNYFSGKAAGVLFIFVAGISSSLTGSNLKRSAKLLAVALLITSVTCLYDRDFLIAFGILHFLGVSILLAGVFMPLPPLALLLMGTAVIYARRLVAGLTVGHNYLFMLGLSDGTFISSDYYPLIPWFGVFLYGLAAGKKFYRQKKGIFGDIGWNDFNLINRIGRHTLLIYLLHQPVIIATITIYEYMTN